MEKIIVKEDSIKKNEILSQVYDSINLINARLPRALKEIGIDKITPELFDDLFKYNAIKTEKDYFTKVDKDLSKLSTEIIKTNMYFDAKEAYDRFYEIYTSIFRQTKYIEYLSINKNGTCELSKKNESEIIELAKDKGIVVMLTEISLFTVCGMLFQAGLRSGQDDIWSE